ncbi:MAG: hypothetical protein KKD44_25485 [Proteobacteria bacterium]|nr:hypothetical protein [Pseudomonadota bacterium]
MHATAICPRDDISEGQINHDLEWTDNRLRYGTFDNRRNDIIKDIEKGNLDIIISGHSHRNIVMEVDSRHENRAKVLGAGETYGTIKRQAKNIVMVTSSGGPLPKYIPGGPKICACPEQYEHGWDFHSHALKSNEFSHYKYNRKKEITNPEKHLCTTCQMPAKKMTAKKGKRHKPGGSLLKFSKGKKTNKMMLTIESVPSDVKGCSPRLGSMNDEHKIFTQSMRLQDIDSLIDYNYWEDEIPINIISRKPFKFFGYMKLPDKVQYVTFLKGNEEYKGLRGQNPKTVGKIEMGDNKIVFKQEVEKDDFDALFGAARREIDFAFTRYIYFSSPQEEWDREIKMFKEISTINNEKSTRFNSKQIDPFEGLVVSFVRKPDLEKRMKICGY